MAARPKRSNAGVPETRFVPRVWSLYPSQQVGGAAYVSQGAKRKAKRKRIEEQLSSEEVQLNKKKRKDRDQQLQ